MKYLFLTLALVQIGVWAEFAHVVTMSRETPECHTDVHLLTSRTSSASCPPNRDVMVVPHGDGVIVTCSCVAPDIDPPTSPMIKSPPTIL